MGGGSRHCAAVQVESGFVTLQQWVLACLSEEGEDDYVRSAAESILKWIDTRVDLHALPKDDNPRWIRG